MVSTFSIRQDIATKLVARLSSAPVDAYQALSSFSPAADATQRRVIEARDHTIRIVAPAGSGKTQTLINRAITRVRDGVRAEQILLLTFDNSAATAITDKFNTQIASLDTPRVVGQELKRIQVSTLNSFGISLLRDFFPEEPRNLSKPWINRRSVRNSLKELQMTHTELRTTLPPTFDVGVYLDLFSLLKNQLFDPRQLNDQTCGEFLLGAPQFSGFFTRPDDLQHTELTIHALIWLFREYEAALNKAGLIDFNDQKLRPYQRLQADPSALDMLQRRYAEVIVDEFQDINLLDFHLVDAIAGRATLVVTGDDDQAIYGFRGCSPDFIINLATHLNRQVRSLELQTNYRCPPNIVDHADRLIRHNEFRIPKQPLPHRTDPSNVQVVSTRSAALEAKSVVAFANRVLRETPNLKHSDVAVLYRTNAQSLPLQLEFVLHDIPYQVREEDNILTNSLLDRLLGILRLKLALEIGQGPLFEDQIDAVLGYIGYSQAWKEDRIRNCFRQSGTLFEIVRSDQFTSIVGESTRDKFGAALERLADVSGLLPTLDLLKDHWKGMRGMVGNLEDVVAQRAPLAEIYDIALDFDGDTRAFLKTLERAIDRAKATAAGSDPDGVFLLTYFRSKGRQWHSVVLTTCNEGLIPHSKAPVEEERRLFYVAMTRASSNLMISYLDDACGKKVTPSRFLDEAGLAELNRLHPGPLASSPSPSDDGLKWYRQRNTGLPQNTSNPPVATASESSRDKQPNQKWWQPKETETSL